MTTHLPTATPWQGFVKWFAAVWIYAYAAVVAAGIVVGVFAGVVCLAECVP